MNQSTTQQKIADKEMSEILRLQKEVERLKSAVDELTVLNELAIAAGRASELDEMLDLIVEKSIKAVKAEQGSILLVTEQKDKPLQTLIRQADHSGRLMAYRVGTHITGWVLKHRQPLLVDHLAEDERFKTTLKEQEDIRSILCVPIWLKAKIIGVLMVTNKKTETPFTPDDLRLLSIIAAQSGQLIRNSQLQTEAHEKRRLENELDLARKMQQSLLPEKNPQSPGMDLASYFLPADAVGGDYFDFFDLGDQKTGIVIADVSGHGPSAALVMTMIKGILQSITLNYTSADRGLGEINSILSRTLPPELFVTMLFLVIDIREKVLYYSNAGHNPFLFYRGSDDSLKMIEVKGCALNVSPNYDYQLHKSALNSGDQIFIYTDGVTESVNGDEEMFQMERMMSAVKISARESAGMVIESVKKELRRFTGDAAQADDMAMIAIKII